MKKFVTASIAAALMSVATAPASQAEVDRSIIQPGTSPACEKVEKAGCYAFWIFDRRMKVDEAFPGGRAVVVLQINGYANADRVIYLEPGRYILIDDQSA